MGNLRLYGATSGYTEVASPDEGTNGTLTLPTSGDIASVKISATEPLDPTPGDFWYNSSTKEISVYDGSSWEEYAPKNSPNFVGTVAADNYNTNVTTAASNTVSVDFSAQTGIITRTATGNVSFSGSNYKAGAAKVVRIVPGSARRTLTFPSGWVFTGEKPTIIPANITGTLYLTSYGTTEADCLARWEIDSAAYAQVNKISGQTFGSGHQTLLLDESPVSKNISLVSNQIRFSFPGVYHIGIGWRFGSAADVWTGVRLWNATTGAVGYSFGTGNIGGSDPGPAMFNFLANITNVTVDYALQIYRQSGSMAVSNPASGAGRAFVATVLKIN